MDRRRALSQHDFAVIGLGRFGSSLGRTLMEGGSTVLGIDADADLVQRYADDLTQTIILDSTDVNALREINIASFNTVVVAIGAHFESSLLTVVNLKELTVPYVIAKASTRVHRDILSKVGADRVVLPEEEGGYLLARELTSSEVINEMALGNGHHLIQVRVPPERVGRQLIDIEDDPRRRRECLVIVGARGLILRPPLETVLKEGDCLVMVDDRIVPAADRANQATEP